MTPSETVLVVVILILCLVHVFSIYIHFMLSQQLRLYVELTTKQENMIEFQNLDRSIKDTIIEGYERKLREYGEDIPTKEERPISATSII